jgi:ABC-type lipoprotein release transport system permease subunit
MGIIFFMAAFGIANTLIMAVYERKREIGILYALGVKRSGIISLFVIEGTLIGIIGGVSAGFLVFFLCSYYGNVGISLSMAEEMTEALNFGGGRLFPSLSLNLTLLCVLSAIGVSALASLYPAWFATRFNPADIIRQ